MTNNGEKLSGETLKNIGERIRLTRKQKKMTQKELAGTEITRNMLSRIENGCALPSLSTLVYIAKRLDVPCGCLLDDEALNDYTKAQSVKLALSYMKNGDYATALDLIEKSDLTLDDETALIVLECDLALAGSLTSDKKYYDAFRLLTDAIDKREATIYNTAGSGYIANLYHALAKRMLPIDKVKPPSEITPVFDKYIDLYIYIRLLDFFDNGQIVKAVNLAAVCEIGDRILSTHIAAMLDMANGRYREASSKLKLIIESESASPTVHGGLMLYRIYGELEQCAKGESDYVSAYTYKEEKLKLYSLMSGIEL